MKINDGQPNGAAIEAMDAAKDCVLKTLAVALQQYDYRRVQSLANALVALDRAQNAMFERRI
jgi:hypothetical protein